MIEDRLRRRCERVDTDQRVDYKHLVEEGLRLGSVIFRQSRSRREVAVVYLRSIRFVREGHKPCLEEPDVGLVEVLVLPGKHHRPRPETLCSRT